VSWRVLKKLHLAVEIVSERACCGSAVILSGESDLDCHFEPDQARLLPEFLCAKYC
jgi:hypothetical protein